MKLDELSAAARDIANLELFLCAYEGVADDWLLSDAMEDNDDLLTLGLLRRCVTALRPGQFVPREAVEGAVEALKAFAAIAEFADAMGYDDDYPCEAAPHSAGEYRKARAALASLKENERADG